MKIFALCILLMTQSTYALFGSSDEDEVKDKEVTEMSNLLASEKNTISVFERNVKSVVNVSNIKLARTGWWFHAQETEVPAGAGSGFVWDKEGHIVTNFHVIQGGDSFIVSFHKDKETYEAEIVGAYPQKDIAVLKLKRKPKKLYPITAGKSAALKVGQKAMAIGNPFGLDHTNLRDSFSNRP
jgi:S1-C subfamily serine protease